MNKSLSLGDLVTMPFNNRQSFGIVALIEDPPYDGFPVKMIFDDGTIRWSNENFSHVAIKKYKVNK